MNYVDLHVHSNASDGTLSPEEVVRYAASKNLKAMALTDHDTIAGIAQAKAAAAECGIELIPGIELSFNYYYANCFEFQHRPVHSAMQINHC